MEFGRKIKRKSRSTDILMIFGTVVCTMTVVLMLNPSSKKKDAMYVADIFSENSEDTSGEPFGYFRGSWNLWEFIGDSVSSLIPGL